ncbi:MAG TPA: MFS transporter [Dehalococcoidia bacterium]|nr:MFS transporter [Dehalococcoidia bacterium]
MTQNRTDSAEAVNSPVSPSLADAYRVLAVSVCAVFLTVMNSSMVHVALPPIMESFQVPVAWATWLQSAYLVPYAIVLPLLGRAGDMYGHRRVMVIGTLVFLGASAACALTTNFPSLLAGRAVQAIGSAALVPNGLAVISAVFPDRQRGRALGVWSAAASIGVVAGPTIAGFLVDRIDWQGIFWVNLPFGAAIALALWRGLPARVGEPGEDTFDIAGALIFGTGLSALLVGITEMRFAGLAPLTVGLMAGGIGLLGLLIWWERRQRSPVICLPLFRIRAFNLLVTTDTLRALAMFSSSLMLPLYFQQVLGWSPLASGLALIPYSLAMLLMSPFGGGLADRYGARPVAGTGLALLAFSMFLYSRLDLDPAFQIMFAALIVCGVAQGLCQAPLTSSVMKVSPEDEYAAASGLFNMFRFISGVIGTTGAGLLISAREGNGLAAGLPVEAARLEGIRLVFLITIVTSLLALGTLYKIGPIRRQAESGAEPDLELAPAQQAPR